MYCSSSTVASSDTLETLLKPRSTKSLSPAWRLVKKPSTMSLSRLWLAANCSTLGTSADFWPGGATTFTAGTKRVLLVTAGTIEGPVAPGVESFGAATPLTQGLSAMYFSSSCMASSPLASVLKLWTTKRRAWTSSSASISFALGMSSLSLNLVMKTLIIWLSTCSCIAAIAVAPLGGTTAPCTFTAGSGTSSSGIGGPAPASFRCARISCRSAFSTSFCQTPPRK
mmetsp:Transcript_55205/g.171527  ORF Transcript_55205/g.171527 Transcript_55205/m.171527 type:complete len:226 (-) Transcript_55205:186-863(-)